MTHFARLLHDILDDVMEGKKKEYDSPLKVKFRFFFFAKRKTSNSDLLQGRAVDINSLLREKGKKWYNQNCRIEKAMSSMGIGKVVLLRQCQI